MEQLETNHRTVSSMAARRVAVTLAGLWWWLVAERASDWREPRIARRESMIASEWWARGRLRLNLRVLLGSTKCAFLRVCFFSTREFWSAEPTEGRAGAAGAAATPQPVRAARCRASLARCRCWLRDRTRSTPIRIRWPSGRGRIGLRLGRARRRRSQFSSAGALRASGKRRAIVPAEQTKSSRAAARP